MSSSHSRPARVPRLVALLPALVAVLLLGGRPSGVGLARADASPGNLGDGLSGLYEEISPAVVRVVSHRTLERQSASTKTRARSIIYNRLVASGVVVAEHGCVVTTDRVAHPGDSLVVYFPDGRWMPASYAGQNDAIHIAVLHLEGDEAFPWLEPYAEDRPLPDWVAAVAYGPWSESRGQGPSLSLAQGTALEAVRIRLADSLGTVWRMKAPVYPGNGGGALLSLAGEWLGLITGSVSGDAPRLPGGGYGGHQEGIIVPAPLVTRAVMQIESGRSPKLEGFLGVKTYRRPVSASDSLWKGIGVIISEVLAGTPAHHGGLLPGDVILRFGEQPVEDAEQLTRVVGRTAPGSRVRMEILRAGEPRELTIRVGDLMSGRMLISRHLEADAQRNQLRREIFQTQQRLRYLQRRLGRLESATQPSAGSAGEASSAVVSEG